jgi:hypothetical protein
MTKNIKFVHNEHKFHRLQEIVTNFNPTDTC